MYNGKVIKKLLSDRNITNKELLEYIGYGKAGGNSSLSQIINGNPTVRRLEPIADFFGISMDTFFKRDVPFNSVTISDFNENEYKAKISSLEQLLKEKDKRIDTLELLVSILQQKEIVLGQISDKTPL